MSFEDDPAEETYWEDHPDNPNNRYHKRPDPRSDGVMEIWLGGKELFDIDEDYADQVLAALNATLPKPFEKTHEDSVGIVEIELSEAPETKMFLQNYVGEGEGPLGKFELGSIIGNGSLLYSFEDINGKKRRFYLGPKQLHAAIERFIEAEK